MESILNNKSIKVNYTNIINKSKPNQINKNNKKSKNNELIKISDEKIYNRNIINKTNNLKNYINNIKNIYANKTNTGNYNHTMNNKMKITEKNKKLIIKSNNNNNVIKNKTNLMNVLIKKKNNNSFNFNNINKLSNTKSINNNKNKILPGLKNNKKSIDNTIKLNKLINKVFTPNIILNDINNKTYNNKNFNFNIINTNKNNINENTITEYPNIIYNKNKINLNNIINLSSKDDSDINLNLFYNNKINNNNTKNKYEIYETDKVNITYDKKTGNKIVNEFYFLETIGRGAYSKVKKCINLNTREEFAVKILNKRLLRKKKKSYGKTKEGTLKINYMIEDAINEINIYKSFPEPNDNIIRLYQILNDNKKDKTYLIMELAQKGPLVTLN